MAAQKILNSRQIGQKIRRIAYEIYENNFEETDLVLAGIKGQGYNMARMLCEIIEEISTINTHLVLINFDKNTPYDTTVEFDCDEQLFEAKTIIVVDDVLNTGRTLAYSLAPFVSIPVKRLQVAVMIDRDYRRFPIKADYVGYALATTIQNHVKVHLEETGEMAALLQ
jgi:pyrimidine operon attenuation protein / uracil phosphoribosyltransferase